MLQGPSSYTNDTLISNFFFCYCGWDFFKYLGAGWAEGKG
jgi:hypothetical protein